MGLMSTLKSALGLEGRLEVKEPAPFALSESARARVAALPEGHAIHISTRAMDRGRTVLVDEGERQGPSPDGYPGLTVGDRDLERLKGLVLEHRDGGWHVSTHLELRARETPNPNGRLYLCNRHLTDGRALFFDSAGPLTPDLPAMLLELPGVRTVLLRDHTVTVERVPDTPWDAVDQGVSVVLRAYFLGCGQRLEAQEVDHGGLMGEVQQVLETTVLPGIHADGGDIELVGIVDGVAQVRLQGACRSCPASTATLQHGVARTLMQAFPGRITGVENVTG
ncbi:MAG: NifU family protein [Myxococcales bacterium]|nr:NifU family protein [Myxococcales bacterium]MCB9671239.1 NifU family protein [Alphaproteobacteria bacterium]